MIIVNFKNYKTGRDVLKLAKKIQKSNKKIIVAVPAVNIMEVAEKTCLRIYAQHVDYSNSKKSTGFITPDSIKSAGAWGTLLNHYEHQVPFDMLKKIIDECKKNKLEIAVCASSIYEVKKLIKLRPDYIAYEDPKIISTSKSITRYNKKSVKKFVKILKKTKIIPLCGAGINSIGDYHEALKLGCVGVLISSAIANSKNQNKFLKDLNIELT